ncbi:MAG: efflux transporter outer membrane subunit [Candidatus Omnitrophota bacterium]
MRSALIVLVLAACCSGCAIAPRYHEPVMEMPQSYRSYKTIQDGEDMINLPWWGVFNDPVLQGLIREALGNNYDLRAAAARVAEARAMVGSAGSQLFPQVDLTAGISRDRNSKNSNPPLSKFLSTYMTGFNTSWEVDLWGKIRQSVSSAKAEYLASENARKGVMVSLVADVAEVYFKILELDLELDIAKKTLKTREDNLDLFTKRFKGGVASELEVSRAEADYQQTAADIPDIERRIAGQENKLSELLGRNPGAIKRTAVLSQESFVPGIPGTGLPSELLKNRPDIMEAEQLLRSANAEVGVALGEFMPSLNLANFVGGEGNNFSKVFDPKGYMWSLGGNTDFPLFDGGKNLYGYAAAKAQFRQYMASYKQKVVGAFREVSDSLVNIEKIKTVREKQENQVAALKKSTDLSRARYEGGYSSYLEVIDADQQYYEAQKILARTQGSQVIYYVQLYRSLGGGWQIEESQK